MKFNTTKMYLTFLFTTVFPVQRGFALSAYMIVHVHTQKSTTCCFSFPMTHD